MIIYARGRSSRPKKGKRSGFVRFSTVLRQFNTTGKQCICGHTCSRQAMHVAIHVHAAALVGKHPKPFERFRGCGLWPFPAGGFPVRILHRRPHGCRQGCGDPVEGFSSFPRASSSDPGCYFAVIRQILRISLCSLFVHWLLAFTVWFVVIPDSVSPQIPHGFRFVSPLNRR